MAFIQVHFGKSWKLASKLCLLGLLMQSCIPGLYKFNDTSFDPDITSFYVPPFDIQAGNAPPTITQTFEEALKLKIRRESQLEENDIDPDIEFQGKVSRFNVTPQAPEAGEAIGFNRLTIGISIDYVDNFHKENQEEYNWSQTFSFFADFGAGENLLDVQDQLIQDISDQIVEDIFNRAFTDW